MELQTFEGKVSQWKPFWDNFHSLIGNKPEISNVEKLNYLRGQLRGHPASMAKAYVVTHENYETVVEMLQNRYGDTRRSKLDLVQDLHNLPCPNHDLEELNEFHVQFETSIRSLENMGFDIKGADWYITASVTNKMNARTLERMQTVTHSEVDDLKQFSEGLLRVITDLEYQSRSRSVKQLRQTSGDVRYTRPIHVDSGRSNRKYGHHRPSSKTDIGNYHVTAAPEHEYAEFDNYYAATNYYEAQPYNEGCAMCGSSIHRPADCNKYYTVASRKRRAEELLRCTICFQPHPAERCHVHIKSCYRCQQGKHHMVFCPYKEKSAEPLPSEKSKLASQVCSLRTETCAVPTALPTAQIEITNTPEPQKSRVFFDQGSQVTFIRSDLVEKMKIQPHKKMMLTITGATSTTEPRLYDVVYVTIRMGESEHQVEAVSYDRVPRTIRTDGIANAAQMLRDKGITLADPEITSDTIGNFSMLIGNDHWHMFVTSIESEGGVALLKCAGGYMISGNIPSKFVTTKFVSTATVMVARLAVTYPAVILSETLTDPVEAGGDVIPLHRLWDLESIGITHESYTPEESSAYENYQQSVQFENAQYWVKMPWKINKPHLPTNYQLAVNRLGSTLNKLKKTPGHLMVYDEIIKGQAEQGFIELVPDAQVNAASHYLPHLAVAKESKTTPLRIVFDCSAKQGKSANSLNDCLYSGPSLTEKLGKVLLKFRTNPFAFAADISKAFLRVGLQEDDRDYTRFLWPENPHDENSKLQTYRFRAVLFGATSSPFLLQATLNHHLEKYDSMYAEKIKASLYVDNLQGTVLTEAELTSLYFAASKIMSEGNMPLQEWCTNSLKLGEILSRKENPTDGSPKLLGVKWNTHEDTLSTKEVVFEDKPLTMRRLLSNVSLLFDPLGLLSPLTITARILMQSTWKLKIGWDTTLPEEVQTEWKTLAASYDGFSHISFPRETCREGRVYDLHVFCDASSKAYGAVAYVTDGKLKPQLLTSKAKVAPVKCKTLPQLELTALYVGVKLQHYIVETLSNIEFKRVYMWSDSEVALQWIRNNASKDVYVRNRVATILEVGSHCAYQHVLTDQNPADYLTRGQSAKKLRENTLWHHGPQWLNQASSWPPQKTQVAIQYRTVETPAPPKIKSPIEGSKYSKLTKLLSVTQNVFTFINRMRGEDLITISPLEYWLKIVQGEEFEDELKYIVNCRGKAPELVSKLGLFLTNGIIRCSGRVDHAELTYAAKFPTLLPKKHWLTTLLVERAHSQSLHGGVQDTLCKLRENYWIPQGRQSVRSTLKKCVICKRIEGQRCTYPAIPPLPQERVGDFGPFEVTGVD